MVQKLFPRMIDGLVNVDQGWTETQTGTRWALTGGASYMALSSGNFLLAYASNDYSTYVSDVLSDVIGSTTRRTLSATGMGLAGNFLPITTETHNLGSTSFEWNNAYLQNAVTVSDERRKIDLGLIDGQQALAFIGALEPRLFRFKDTVIPAREETILVEAIDGDGKSHMVPKIILHPESVVPHKRPHSGFFAQQVKEAMTAAAIEDCGVYAYDPESDTHVLRLFEMVAWLTAGMKALMAREPVAQIPPAPVAAAPTIDPNSDLREQLRLANEQLEALRNREPEVRIVEVEKIVHVEVPVASEAFRFPASLDERLSDYAPVGDEPVPLSKDEADAEAGRILSNMAEGFDVGDEISGLSSVRREELTQALHRKKGAMRRARMTGSVPEEAEGAIDQLVGLLARRGV